MHGIKDDQISACRGFTLIEILLVFILISLVLGMSVVYFAGTLPKARQKAAAREIVSAIKYTRSLAALKNERQMLIFDLDAGHYGIVGRASKEIPDEMRLVIIESDINADPVSRGRYSLYYDSAGTNNWEQIRLIRGDRIIRIKADPVFAAMIADEEQDGGHD
jgi:general secretion pathway protein H